MLPSEPEKRVPVSNSCGKRGNLGCLSYRGATRGGPEERADFRRDRGGCVHRSGQYNPRFPDAVVTPRRDGYTLDALMSKKKYSMVALPKRALEGTNSLLLFAGVSRLHCPIAFPRPR